MDIQKNYNYTPQLSSELQFIQSLLSFSDGVQKLDSDHLIIPNYDLNINSESNHHLNLQEAHSDNKITDSQTYQKPQPLNQSLRNQLGSNGDCNNQRMKDQIKTYPNFIIRSFSNYLDKYLHFYNKKDGLEILQSYLNQLCGAKHYTLQHLQDLFQDDSRWNSRKNRTVLQHILAKYSYSDIFNNAQRKKKKTYLIMTKVYKLRAKNANLCSRVQCQ